MCRAKRGREIASYVRASNRRACNKGIGNASLHCSMQREVPSGPSRPGKNEALSLLTTKDELILKAGTRVPWEVARTCSMDPGMWGYPRPRQPTQLGYLRHAREKRRRWPGSALCSFADGDRGRCGESRGFEPGNATTHSIRATRSSSLPHWPCLEKTCLVMNWL